MRFTRRFVLHTTLTLALACSFRAKAQHAPLPGPVPLVTNPPAYRLTLDDARQRALATSKGLGLANLGIQEKREAIAAARTDYLPKVLGSDLYFHFNGNLGVVETLRTGRLGLLPPGARTVAVRAVNQDSNLLSLTLSSPSRS